MSTTVEREWIAVADDEILYEADTSGKVYEWLYHSDYHESEVDVLAVPKVHKSLYI